MEHTLHIIYLFLSRYEPQLKYTYIYWVLVITTVNGKQERDNNGQQQLLQLQSAITFKFKCNYLNKEV